METQSEIIFTKLKSDELTVLASGLDDAKALVDQLAQRAVSTLFTASDQNRFAVADKLFAMGPAVIPELERRIENEEQPEAMAHAALILFKRGSMKGVPRLIQSLKDRVGPIGTIASALASAQIPGTSEALTSVIPNMPSLSATSSTSPRDEQHALFGFRKHRLSGLSRRQ
jgi:hypothetical protein